MAHEGYYSESSNLGNVNDLLDEAELYRDQANASAISAATSETNAAASAATAVSSASDASTSASAAASSATNSSNSATNSLDSSNAASLSASNAATSASAAAASAASIDPASLLTKAGNLSGLADKAISRENLGIFNFAKNKIISGKIDIAQRGTSFSSGNNIYTVDRFLVDYIADGSATTSQSTDAPLTNEFQYSLRLTSNTADVAIAAAQYARLEQKIEGYNIRDLIGKTFTLSFWVRSSKSGVHCISFRNSAADRSYLAEYTINTINTWEYKTITVTGGIPTAGAWNWTSGVGLGVSFVIACGDTFKTTPNAWQTGNYLGTANQVNCLDTVGNIFAITGVQLEVGSVATPFEHRHYGQELALCQRYYQRLRCEFSVGVSTSGSGYGGTVPFKGDMRAVPTISMISGTDIQSGFPAGAPSVISVGTGSAWLVKSANSSAASAWWESTIECQAEL